jgi:hypothetical protein
MEGAAAAQGKLGKAVESIECVGVGDGAPNGFAEAVAIVVVSKGGDGGGTALGFAELIKLVAVEAIGGVPVRKVSCQGAGDGGEEVFCCIVTMRGGGWAATRSDCLGLTDELAALVVGVFDQAIREAWIGVDFL